MNILFFVLFFVEALAGPEEDLVDRILASYLEENVVKNVSLPNFLYPSEIELGPLTSVINIDFEYGYLVFKSIKRTGPVDDVSDLRFQVTIDALYSFLYNFRDCVPPPYSSGYTTISWVVPVSMRVAINQNRASLVTSDLLQDGSLRAYFAPHFSARSASLYPRNDSSFASKLYEILNRYLKETFINIPVH